MGPGAKAAPAGALEALSKNLPDTGPKVQVLTTPVFGGVGAAALRSADTPIQMGIDMHDTSNSPKGNELPPLLTEEAVSRATSLPVSTLRALRAAGQFPDAVQLTPRVVSKAGGVK